MYGSDAVLDGDYGRDGADDEIVDDAHADEVDEKDHKDDEHIVDVECSPIAMPAKIIVLP